MINSSQTTPYAWLRRTLVLPVTLAVIATLSLSSEAQTKPQVAKPIVQSSTDTIPKKSVEPVTVTGYRLKRKGKQQTTPSAPAQSLEPITVEGHRLEKKAKQKSEDKKAI